MLQRQLSTVRAAVRASTQLRTSSMPRTLPFRTLLSVCTRCRGSFGDNSRQFSVSDYFSYHAPVAKHDVQFHAVVRRRQKFPSVTSPAIDRPPAITDGKMGHSTNVMKMVCFCGNAFPQTTLNTAECPSCTLICALPYKCGHSCRSKCHDHVLVDRNAADNAKARGFWDRKEKALEYITQACPPCMEPVQVMCIGGHDSIPMPCT